MQYWVVGVSRLISNAMGFFYAVARGRSPGIYATWDECKAQVHGFPKPVYKKFPSKSEAEDFVASKGSKTSEFLADSETCSQFEYDSSGRTTKVEPTHNELRKKTQAWTKDKISNNVNEPSNNAEQLLSRLESKISGLATNGIPIPTRIKNLESILLSMHQELYDIKRHFSTSARTSTDFSGNRKRKRLGDSEDIGRLKNSIDQDPDPSLQGGFNVDERGFVNVFTDGACSGNGQLGAMAGIGVWFNDNHPLNVSRPVTNGSRATNNLAEIQAVTEAAKQAAKAGVKKLKINTDSQFLISCITQWMPKWKKNGWRKADGEHVINKEELILMEKALQPLEIAWNHVRGHAGVRGNEEADKLARAGANAQRKN
ncbi:ribonuclease H1 [Athalia rosae]|uniref:ribonuclease H1 n=1 Tax=Athalia rosae TaxID=37344 RepID=UPI002033A44C|nr:ribonuclease H1 [Athalia rosae]XP_020711337.2 ribonuclease H1 [Athalia rosae]